MAGLSAAVTLVQARNVDRVPRHEHLDTRYHHDRAYPNRGSRVAKLPAPHVDETFNGRHYYFARGVWYRPHGTGFLVVAPPAGLYVPNLPPYYTTLWVGGVPYYYANDVFYVYRGATRGFEIVPPPPDERTAHPRAPPAQAPTANAQLFVYPARHQSPAQQARDKRQCQHWAGHQTGFKPGAAKRRADYDRAITACLEGRGYTVR